MFSLPLFNPAIRESILDVLDKTDSKKHFKLYSLLPVIISFILTFLIPFISDVIPIFADTILAFNGIIVPLLMKIKILMF